MPMLIEHIDAIARNKQRDVLYVKFHRWVQDKVIGSRLISPNWQKLPIRQNIIDWLEARGIAWQPCAHYADPNLMLSYQGQIYIDLPYDKMLPAYKELESFLEYPNGTMRYDDAVFCRLGFSHAMKNASHDEPGYWDRWAENF